MKQRRRWKLQKESKELKMWNCKSGILNNPTNISVKLMIVWRNLVQRMVWIIMSERTLVCHLINVMCAIRPLKAQAFVVGTSKYTQRVRISVVIFVVKHSLKRVICLNTWISMREQNPSYARIAARASRRRSILIVIQWSIRNRSPGNVNNVAASSPRSPVWAGMSRTCMTRRQCSRLRGWPRQLMVRRWQSHQRFRSPQMLME